MKERERDMKEILKYFDEEFTKKERVLIKVILIALVIISLFLNKMIDDDVNTCIKNGNDIKVCEELRKWKEK